MALAQSRLRAVNRISGGKGRRLGGLPTGKQVREVLWFEANLAPDPATQLRAAVLLALNRGAAIKRVARAAGLSRQAVHKSWARLMDKHGEARDSAAMKQTGGIRS